MLGNHIKMFKLKKSSNFSLNFFTEMTKTDKIESFQIADNYNPKKGKFQQILA